MLGRVKLYYATMRHLKLKQIYWQLRYRLYRSKPIKTVMLVNTAEASVSYVQWLTKSSHVSDSEISLINIKRPYQLPSIWEDKSGDDLWFYNIHYFDYLNNSEVNDSIKLKLVLNWIENVDDNSLGWHAYPTSLRIVNWIKWIIKNEITDQKMLQSLYSQCCHLDKNIEHHILANHFFANIKALIIAGLFFDDAKSKKWFEKYSKLCSIQLKVQVLENGGHYELSPMYHNIVLEDILDIISFYKIYSKAIPQKFYNTVRSMLVWSEAMTHPDGEVSFFNDSAEGAAPTYSQLACYAVLLGIPVELKQEAIRDCDGYFIARKKYWDLKFDAADVKANHQPGHTHADTLSFELSVSGKRFFVNSGISNYHDLDKRMHQRSTKAHNSIVIDGKNSSNVWSKFRLARRAKILDRSAVINDKEIFLYASHDGYRLLSGSLTCSRKINLNSNCITIEDIVTGLGGRKIQLFFFLHPDVVISEQGDGLMLMRGDVLLKISTKSLICLKDSTYYPRFNSEKENKVIVVEGVMNESYSHVLTIEKIA